MSIVTLHTLIVISMAHEYLLKSEIHTLHEVSQNCCMMLVVDEQAGIHPSSGRLKFNSAEFHFLPYFFSTFNSSVSSSSSSSSSPHIFCSSFSFKNPNCQRYPFFAGRLYAQSCDPKREINLFSYLSILRH